MAFQKPHELHQRRFGRNLGVLLTLIAFAVLIFGITVVKIANGSLMEAYDHQPRASQLPITEPRP
jgi:cell division protein FtsI/penicillin-binding protein 2